MRPDRRSGHRHADEGSILALTLVLTLVSSLIVMALLAYVATVLRVRPGVEDRAVASETTRSAIRQAVQLQRVAGPAECFATTQVIEINGLPTEVRCAVTAIDFDNVLMRNRFGVVTTSNRADDGGAPVSPISGAAGSAATKAITGDVFVNAGSIGAMTADIAITGQSTDGSPAAALGSTFAYPAAPDPVRYAIPGPPDVAADCVGAGAFYQVATGTDWQCTTDPWTARAGSNPDPATGPWVYPYVPPVPTQQRSSTPITIDRNGTPCNVFYPGWYPNGLDLDGGKYYFASGVYYFEGPVTVRNGATAVGGEGLHDGCVVDSEAALYNGPTQRAPKVHSITGNGTTFLLGDDATIDVTRATLLLNRRFSTETTRATEGISIRSVNTTTTDTADVFVPEDQVFAQETMPTVPASTTTYVDSEPVGGWNAPIVRFDTTVGGPAPTAAAPYRFSAGAIFVPNAAIEFRSTTPHYALDVTGGTTSTRLALDLATLPSDPDDYFVGVKKTAVQSELRFDALVTMPTGRQTVSSSVMQLNMNGEYAVNSWTLDIGAVGVDPTNGGAGVGGLP